MFEKWVRIRSYFHKSLIPQWRDHICVTLQGCLKDFRWILCITLSMIQASSKFQRVYKMRSGRYPGKTCSSVAFIYGCYFVWVLILFALGFLFVGWVFLGFVFSFFGWLVVYFVLLLVLFVFFLFLLGFFGLVWFFSFILTLKRK